MTALSEQMRASAKQFREGADVLLSETNAAALAGDVRQQIAAVVGKVSAVVFDALADVVDAGGLTAQLDEKTLRRKLVMERLDGIRRAAAAGKWDEYDRLVAGFDPGTGTPAGTASQ